MIALITTEAEVRTWVGAGAPADVFTLAWKAADAYVAGRVKLPVDEPAPADIVQAVALLTGRLIARRNSPDGMIGMGDLGSFRIPGTDADVSRLIAPYRPVVFG